MTEQNATVSVCLPTYNRAALLRQAIESVLGQTFTDLELIVADNASTDDTLEVVKSFRDSRIQYFRNERNLGAPANWVVAASHARGTLCAFTGDDDLWDPRFLEHLASPLLADQSILVSFSDHWVIGGDGGVREDMTNAYSRAYGRARLQRGRYQPFVDLALRQQALLTSAAVIRLESMRATGALDARAGLVLDYYLFARLSLGGGAAFYEPQRLAYYRVHAGGASASRQSELWQDMEWVCTELISRAADPLDVEALRRRRALAAARRCRSLVRAGKPGQAAQALVSILRHALTR